MTPIGKSNGEYVAKILAERSTGSQDNWPEFLGKAWDMILIIEQLGFLNKQKFWGPKDL